MAFLPSERVFSSANSVTFCMSYFKHFFADFKVHFLFLLLLH